MKKSLFAFAVVVAASLFAADAPTYSCGLRVGTPKLESKQQKDGNDGIKRGNTSTKTSNSTMTWPVKVSFSGKEFPKSIVLKACFIGTRDGKPEVLGESSVDVVLNEVNVFKTDIVSPSTSLTRTMKRTGWGKNQRTVSDTTGDRVTGCIIRLVADGKVIKSYASKSTWAKFAKQEMLDTDAILKFR